jgi:hypothetical protein
LKILEERTKETAQVLAELLPLMKDAGKSQAMASILTNLQALFKKMVGFLEKFSRRKYISTLLRGHSDAKALEVMDGQLTTILQNLSLSADRANLQLQQKTFSEIAKVAQMIESSGGTQGLQDDAAAAQRVADLAGVPLSDLQGEMQVFFEEMRASQDRIESKLDMLCSTANAGAGEGGAGSKPPDADAFWHKYFDSKTVELEHFLPVFEDEFCGETELNSGQRKAFVALIDKYPRDGLVVMIEWCVGGC